MKTGRLWGIILAAVMLGTAAAAAGCAVQNGNGTGEAAVQAGKEQNSAVEAIPQEEAAAEPDDAAAAEDNIGQPAEDDRVYAPGPYGRVSIRIPEGWESRVVAAGSDEMGAGAVYGIQYSPANEKEGCIELGYAVLFGVCGTGLTQEEVQIAGVRASIGTYNDGPNDTDTTWDFITFRDAYEGIVAVANMTMNWTEKEKEEAREILESLVFEPAVREGGIGYYRHDAEIPELGLMAQARDIHADHATVRFSIWDPAAADGELIYGDDFVLEKQVDGDFYEELPPVIDGEIAFNDIGYTILPDGNNDWIVNWEWLYGKIEPGDYRIRKSVNNWRAPGDFDRYDIYAYFLYAGEPAEGPSEMTGQTEKDAQNDAAADGKGMEQILCDYPPAAGGKNAQTFLESNAHWDWWQKQREKIEASAKVQTGMDAYYAAILQEMLTAKDGDGRPENAVCSPLNIYTALAMLAEVTDGNTRAEILDVLQAEDIDSVRASAKALWEANYADTPALKSIPAASMWLNNRLDYHTDTLKKLAGDYYASSFSGEMGSEEMNRALQQWTDDNTGGLLSEQTKNMKLERETVLALVTTIYYKASWTDRFAAERTGEGIFHGTGGDQPVPMMHMDRMTSVYPGSCFTAISLGLTDSGCMNFFLPDEGTDVQELASGTALQEVLKIGRAAGETESYYPIVHLSMPKFSVSKQTGLIEVLQNLGIRDAMIPGIADFSPLTDDIDEVYVSDASHAALVEIDEEGVTGAAYTELAMAAGAAMPQDEIDLVFDRPFLFTVTARDGSILFAGIVQDME